MPHNSNGRHQVGGILALLASGSLLLAAGPALARPNCGDWNTWDFFYQATAADVGRCLSQGADPNARDEDRYTPLLSVLGKAVLADLAGADLEARADVEVVKVLLAAGADPNARGVTPLHGAARLSETPAVVKALLAAGADLEARDEHGLTPLHRAAISKTPAVVKALLAAGADPNARAKGGVTPLHMAARLSETPAVVKVLLDAGADASAKTNKGKLPVELIPDDSPLRGTDVYWRLNEGRYR